MKIALLLPLLALGLAGCRSSSHAFRFQTSPQEARIEPHEEGAIRATALISALEGRLNYETRDPEMHLRVRIENDGTLPVHLDPDGIELVTSDLIPFGPPRVEPAPGTEIDAGDTHTYDLWFPYPPGTPVHFPSLRGIHVSLDVRYPGGTAEVSATFERPRVQRVYYDEPSFRIHWGIGIHHVHCR